MQPVARIPVNLFLSYSRADSTLVETFLKHLAPLKTTGLVRTWYDRELKPGADWDREIQEHLEQSDIVVLLISADFLATDYCVTHEFRRALERHSDGEIRIIPVILRPVRWETTPIGQFQALPTRAVPVSRWPSADEAFEDVVRGIEGTVAEFSEARLSVRKARESFRLRVGLSALCDRQDQEAEFLFTFDEEMSALARPQIFFTFGSDLDRHDLLVQRLFNRQIISWVSLRNRSALGVITLDPRVCTDMERTKKIFTVELYEAIYSQANQILPQPSAFVHDSGASLVAGLREHSLIALQHNVDGAAPFEWITGFWNWYLNKFWQDTLDSSRPRVVVFANIVFPVEKRSWFRLGTRVDSSRIMRRSVVNALRRLCLEIKPNCRAVCLPELTPVHQKHIEEWIRKCGFYRSIDAISRQASTIVSEASRWPQRTAPMDAVVQCLDDFRKCFAEGNAYPCGRLARSTKVGV